MTSGRASGPAGEGDLARRPGRERRLHRRARCRCRGAVRPRMGCRRARTRAAPVRRRARPRRMRTRRDGERPRDSQRRRSATRRRCLVESTMRDVAEVSGASATELTNLLQRARGRARSAAAGEPGDHVDRLSPSDPGRDELRDRARARRRRRPATRPLVGPRTSVISPLGGSAKRSASSPSVPRATSSKRFVSSRHTAAGTFGHRLRRERPATPASRRGDSKATTECGQRAELPREPRSSSARPPRQVADELVAVGR